MKDYPFHKMIPVLLVLSMAFFAGRGIAEFAGDVKNWNLTKELAGAGYVNKETEETALTAAGASTGTAASNLVAESSPSGTAALGNWPFSLNSPMMPGTENWGLGFGTQGAKPAGNATPAELKKYNAYFVAPGEEKKIYLTFDCGYENGNTEAILDALKSHQAPATFFVVGHYLESAPELVKRMVAEGHAVGDHTYHHPDMSKISDSATFQKEMDDVRILFHEVTGQEMPMYYRPPQGKYNAENLKLAKSFGYSTFFWSLAYVDWNVNDQPTREEAISKLTTRIHPGAIVLLHNTSRTNAEIMDELLTKWEEMGYSFAPLSDLLNP